MSPPVRFSSGDRDDYRHWSFVLAIVDAAWNGIPNPYEHVLANRKQKPHRDPVSRPVLTAADTITSPAPIRKRIHEVDVRDGRQWVQSILTYLEFRAGTKWRPRCQKLDSPYFDAYRLVSDRFNDPHFIPTEKPEVSDVPSLPRRQPEPLLPLTKDRRRGIAIQARMMGGGSPARRGRPHYRSHRFLMRPGMSDAVRLLFHVKQWFEESAQVTDGAHVNQYTLPQFVAEIVEGYIAEEFRGVAGVDLCEFLRRRADGEQLRHFVRRAICRVRPVRRSDLEALCQKAS